MPQKLPPTEHAVFYHIFQVHLQAVLWKGLTSTALDPSSYGWHTVNECYTPNLSDRPPVPDELLNVIRCRLTVSLHCAHAGEMVCRVLLHVLAAMVSRAVMLTLPLCG